MPNPEAAPTAEQLKNEWNAMAAEREGPADTALPEPKTPEPTEPKPAATPAAQPAPAAPPEPTLADVLTKMGNFEQELKRTTGRVSALQSKLDQGTRAASTVAPKDAPTRAEQAAAVKDPEEWEELKKDYPEWATAMEKFVGGRLTAALNGLPKPAPAAAPVEPAQSPGPSESDRIERRHKGWQDTVKSAEFRAWQASQPDDVKALGDSPYAEDAIEMLGLFARRTQAKNIQQERENRLNEAANGNPGRPAAAGTGGAELTPKELWDLEAKKREQRRQY